jgi:hypothetical protein
MIKKRAPAKEIARFESEVGAALGALSGVSEEAMAYFELGYYTAALSILREEENELLTSAVEQKRADADRRARQP